MMLALKDGGNGKGRRERRQSPTKSRENDVAHVSVGGADEAIRKVPCDTAAESISRDGCPRAIRGTAASHRVLHQIANETTAGADQGSEKEGHRASLCSPSHAARTPLRIAPKAIKTHPLGLTCLIAARSTKSPEYEVKPPKNP